MKGLYASFDADEIKRKWHRTVFAKKTYNTQTSLAALVLTESWVDGWRPERTAAHGRVPLTVLGKGRWP